MLRRGSAVLTPTPTPTPGSRSAPTPTPGSRSAPTPTPTPTPGLMRNTMKSVAFSRLLTLFLSGFFNANSVRGGADSAPPLRSRKLRSVETFCKRHWIGCDVISNFCKGHFQVRSILRSPEATKGQISRKWLFFRKHSLLSP